MGFWRDWIHAGGTGGLNWHLHARAHRQQWQPTCDLIENFLLKSSPANPHLVLIGASAGWMLPSRWLCQFQRIDSYDIDPLASWLFARRHGALLRQAGVQLRAHRRDALALLPEILREHQDACLWFDNLLGQQRYRIRDELETERQLNALKIQLAGRTWGSIHDVFSGPGTLTLPTPQTLAQAKGRAQEFGDVRMQALLQQLSASGTWFDHGTRGVFPGTTPVEMVSWPFRPGYWHWLQMGWCSA